MSGFDVSGAARLGSTNRELVSLLYWITVVENFVTCRE
jgi:hypothetical protein